MQTFPRTRRGYPSDVTDAQWRRIELFIPAEKQRGRHREIDLREVVNAIHYRWTTGCVWRMLPHDFPAWGTVYTYFHGWQRDGLLTQLRTELLKPSRRASGVNRNADVPADHHDEPTQHRDHCETRWDCTDPDRKSEPCRDSERAA